MHVQSCCFAYRTPIVVFDVLVAVASWDRKVPIAETIVLINKVTNKYAVTLYNFLVHIVNEEKKKSLNS